MSDVNERKRDEAVVVFNAGVRAMQAGDEAAAVEAWEKAVQLDRTLVPALRNLVTHHEAKENWSRAVVLYGDLLSFDPFDTTLLVRQAASFRRLGDFSGAIANYRRAIAVYPYYRFWYDELGQLFEEFGSETEGARWRERGREIDSDTAEMAFEDGVRQMRLRNFELASAIFEALIEEFPKNLEARIKYALCLTALDRHEDALRELDSALNLGEVASALVVFNRGLVLLDLNKVDPAKEAFRKAIQLEPGYGRAKRMLERCEQQAQAVESVPDVPAGIDAAALPGPNREHHWTRQVFECIYHATALSVRENRAGRVALFLEPEPQLLPVARKVLEIVRAPDLRVAGQVFVAEGEPRDRTGRAGLLAQGWLGSSEYPATDFGAWTAPSVGLPIDRLLEAAATAGGDQGFSLIIIVGTGRVREDQTATLRLVRQFPTYQFILVRPGTQQSQLSVRMKGVAPNWAEIIAT